MTALEIAKGLASPTDNPSQVRTGTKKPNSGFFGASSSLANQSYRCGADF
jgi:hypothetical protein